MLTIDSEAEAGHWAALSNTVVLYGPTNLMTLWCTQFQLIISEKVVVSLTYRVVNEEEMQEMLNPQMPRISCNESFLKTMPGKCLPRRAGWVKSC